MEKMVLVDSFPEKMESQLFIAWVPFQRRSVSMQNYFGYNLVFISFALKYRWLRWLEYIFKLTRTLILFFTYRPKVFWVQLPPNFILHIIILLKILFANNMKIVSDCHNATFRSPWIKIPGTIYCLNKCDAVVVHNSSVLSEAIKLGIKKDCLVVLEDPPAEIGMPKHLQETSKVSSNPLLVFPCSFNADEPIKEIIEAARLAPDISFALSGNFNRARGIHSLSSLPNNIELTGFLSETEFDKLLYRADLILGFTKLDGVQLSVANEAVGIGKPLVLSDTQLLKKLFYKGAVFVNSNSPESVVEGCRTALAKLDTLSHEVRELKTERDQSWRQEAQQVLRKLEPDSEPTK
jgi:hypothetical protein